MNPLKWFQRLDHWTDRRPVGALLLISTICLLGGVMTLKWQEDTGLTLNQAWHLVGFLEGMVFATLLHVVDVLRRRGS